MGDTTKNFSIKQENGTYFIEGFLNEFSNLDEIAPDENNTITINLSGVSLINSVGILTWLKMVRAFPQAKLILHKVSFPFMSSIVMMPDLLGHHPLDVIEEFHAPFDCPDCSEDFETLIKYADVELKDEEVNVPPVPCPKCGSSSPCMEEQFEYLFGLLGD